MNISAPRLRFVNNLSFSPDSSNFFWSCLPGHPLVCKLAWCVTLNGPKEDTNLTFTQYIHTECVKKNTSLHTPVRKDINFDGGNISRGALCISLLSCNGNIIEWVCVASNLIFSLVLFPLKCPIKRWLIKNGGLPLIKEVNYEWLTWYGWAAPLCHSSFFSMGELGRGAIGNTTQKELLEQ